MSVIMHADQATVCRPPDWAGIGSCALPVAAGDITGLLECHALVLTTSGPVTAEIDFTAHRCDPGTLIWVRPGQSVRFDVGDPAGTTTVVFRPGLFAPGELPGLTPEDPIGPGRSPVPLPDLAAFEQLARDAAGLSPQTRSPDPAAAKARDAGAAKALARDPAAAKALLRHELAALLLRIRLLDAPGSAEAHIESQTFERFRRRLEDGYPHSRRVEDYAGELGCSVRTLTRASLALTGRTAKQVVDDRVALQAQRLLAATPLSVAEVGRSLGFAEPTNFGRFFHRETGLSPGQFRARFAPDRPAGIPGQRRPSD